MTSFEVIEHEKDPKGEHGEYRIIAINFIDPEYVKIVADMDVDKGTSLDVEDDIVFLNKKSIGKVVEKKDGKSIRVSTSFDIKYTGGYSLDGSTVYLDEHFPQIMKIDGREVDARESIGLHHELPEKWLSDEAYEYPYAHEVATGIEKKYVESLGVKWKDYCDEVDRNLRNVYSRKLEKSPPSLDLAPYLYCRDQEALKEIRRSSTK
ncbi:MAG: hypothetical protein ACYCT2_05965 [Thermoplasmataceae archaeon]